MAEQIELQIVLKDAATPALANTRAGAQQAALANGALAKSFDAVETEARQAAGALDGVAAKSNQAAVAATSTASSMVAVGSAARSGAGGMRNFGQAGLEVSRAFEDLQYGFGGIVNNIPSLVAALGGGAGLAGAFSLAAVAANQLIKNFDGFETGTDRAVAAAKTSIASLTEEIAAARDEMDALARGTSTEFLRAERIVAEKQKAFDEARAKFGEEKFARAEAALASMPKLTGVAHLDREIEKERRVFIDDGQQKAFNDLITLQRDLEVASEHRFLIENKLEGERIADIEERIRREEEAEKKRLAGLAKVARAEADARQRAEADEIAASARAEAERLAERESARQAEDDAEQSQMLRLARSEAEALAEAEKEAAREARDAAREAKKEAREAARAHAHAEREKTRIAKEEAREREAIAKHEAQQIVGFYSAMSGAVVEAAVAGAAGQKDAFKNLVMTAAKETGGLITLKGGELAAAGVAGTLLGNPAGPGQMLAGAALITAGQAVAIGGPAVVASVFGGGAGSFGGGNARTSGGVGGAGSRRSSSSTSTEASVMEVNVYYGGPPIGRARENVAIDVAETERINRRRGRRGRP